MTGGTGINVTGDNATANQTGDTSWSVAIDDTVALKSDIPAIPPIPSVPDNIVETLNGLTGNLTLESSDDNIVVAENGTDKINLTLNANLSDLSDVSNQTPADDQILTYNGTSNAWEPAASQSGGVTTLAALDDTNVSAPEEGQTLVWNNTDSKWENKAASAGVSNLPISSVDGTVILADDGAGSLTVTTGSTMNFEVDQNGHVVINPGDSSTPSLPRANTMLEVVSDSDSLFGLILDGTKAAGVYEGRSGIRQYGAATTFEYCIDDTNQAYMFSGGSNARSSILYGDVNADIYVKPNEYVRLQPQVRVNEITTRDAADGDGTIELSGQTVSIKSNSLERVRVDENGLVGVCSTDKGMGTINSGLKIGTDKSIGSQIIVYGEVASSYGQFVGVNLDMETATEFVAYQSSQCVNYAGDDAKVASYKDFKTANHDDHVTAQYGFYSDVANRQDADGNDLVRYQFYAATSAESYFGGMIRARDVKGYADNDAHLILRQQAYIYAEYGTPFVVESDKDASFINFKNGNGFSYFAGIGTTREFEIAADGASPTFARFRLSTDCTLTAGDGTPWACPSDDSIMTRRETEKFVTGGGTNATGGYLPLAGGTMDIGRRCHDAIG